MVSEVIEVSKRRQILCAWWIFTLAASFYLYEFILQVSPSVMTAGLMRDFQVSAAGLGIISSAYFMAYMPMQIIAGLLFDRYSTRSLITLAVLICVLGAICFGITDSRFFASVSRFAMGVGSAFSFIGTLLLIRRWFPARYYASLVGMAQSLSSIGAVVGQSVLPILILAVGWRSGMFYLAILGCFIAALIWYFVRDYPAGEARPIEHHDIHIMDQIRAVLHNPQTWYVGLYTFCVWAPIVVFAVLWGVPYLERFYHVGVRIAGYGVSLIWVGVAVGSPLFGWVSDRISRRCLPMQVSALLGLCVLLVLLLVQSLSWWHMAILLFLFGMSASGQVVSFGVVQDINQRKYLGTACGVNNMWTVAGGAVLQPLVGVIMNYYWDGQHLDGIPYYSIHAYQKALFVLPVCFLVAIVLSTFFIKETHCRNLHSE